MKEWINEAESNLRECGKSLVAFEKLRLERDQMMSWRKSKTKIVFSLQSKCNFRMHRHSCQLKRGIPLHLYQVQAVNRVCSHRFSYFGKLFLWSNQRSLSHPGCLHQVSVSHSMLLHTQTLHRTSTLLRLESVSELVHYLIISTGTTIDLTCLSPPSSLTGFGNWKGGICMYRFTWSEKWSNPVGGDEKTPK